MISTLKHNKMVLAVSVVLSPGAMHSVAAGAVMSCFFQHNNLGLDSTCHDSCVVGIADGVCGSGLLLPDFMGMTIRKGSDQQDFLREFPNG